MRASASRVAEGTSHTATILTTTKTTETQRRKQIGKPQSRGLFSPEAALAISKPLFSVSSVVHNILPSIARRLGAVQDGPGVMPANSCLNLRALTVLFLCKRTEPTGGQKWFVSSEAR